MNKFAVLQFLALLRREVLEHRNLFIWAPVVVGLLVFVVDFLIVSSLDDELRNAMLDYLADFFGRARTGDVAPLFVFAALPFVAVFYLCAILYLSSTLYQDRRDASVLFWQSMPVSNLKTVLSKLASIVVIAPVFYVAVIGVLYTLGILWLMVTGFNAVGGGLAAMFLAALASLPVIYLFTVTSGLWLLPFFGWLLLFSAFANRTPLLWALASLTVLVLLESFIFGTRFLSNWINTRAGIDNFLVVEYGGLAARLFSYDMLAGIVVGSVLIAGAVNMRRFVD